MSGLEIAGLVLGAFPIALEILDRYKEVAKRMHFWYRIAAEHKKCESKVEFQRAVYMSNLRWLLFPVAMLDDAGVEELLRNPGGEAWRNDETASMLKQRLGSSYDLYLKCMDDFKEVLDALNLELALESDGSRKQTAQVSGKIASAAEKIKSQSKWHIYRLKFSQGEKERDRLFAELQNYNDKLKTLLQISEGDKYLARDRLSQKAKLSSAVLSQLWREACAIFAALSTVLKCDCRAQHSAKLLLEHRTKEKTDFNLMFEKLIQPRLESHRFSLSRKDKASIGVASPCEESPLRTVTLFEPKHRNATPKKSAMRKARLPTDTSYLRPPPSIALTTFEPDADSATTQAPDPIKSLCLSLEKSGEECCGYLKQDDYLYLVYKHPSRPVSSPDFVTLDQLLRKHDLTMPKRRQRFALAYILASSFLQLLESPWLPASWHKSDIIFYQDLKQPGQYALDQPHLNHSLVPQMESGPLTEQDRRMQLSSSLEMLGIVLLELCFGALLEEQPYRTKYPTSGNDQFERIFDGAAAKEWHGDVEEDVGYEYAVAVGWCLGGILSTPPDKWREEMLQKVVQPLGACHGHLSQLKNM